MSQTFERLLGRTTLGLIFATTSVVAQDTADSPLPSPLDQVVPVAEAPPAESPPPEITDEELLRTEFLRYRELMGDGIFDEADNVAKRIVELTIRQHGPESTQTANALTNLAIVQRRSGQYDAALQNFTSAIDIIENVEDRLNGNLVNPLRGLAASQLESGRPDLAARSYGRAVHITHVNEGPHNLEQLELLESLAETNLRMGLVKDAKRVHDTIYALNLRAYRSNPVDMVPSLMRRASWQHRTGYIIDERSTYRRIIRIIEQASDKHDVRLIPPLTRLGRSYFYVDRSGVETFNQPGPKTGEIYFKRALRIAKSNPEGDWNITADALMALGDYYMLDTNMLRAREHYDEAWQLLSEEEDRYGKRDQLLGTIHNLKANDLPGYFGETPSEDGIEEDDKLLEGSVTVTFDVSERGRVANLKIIESNPVEFTSMARRVQRGVRSRLYRPRYEDGTAVPTTGLTRVHSFYYRQSELEAVRARKEAESAEAEGDKSS